MKIGDLSNLTGETPDTLRYYERIGLIQAGRRGNGYREYPAETAELVRLIRLAQGFGFSLTEVKAVLPLFRDGEVPEETLRQLLNDKLLLVDERLAALTQLRDELAHRLTTVCPLRRKAQGSA